MLARSFGPFSFDDQKVVKIPLHIETISVFGLDFIEIHFPETGYSLAAKDVAAYRFFVVHGPDLLSKNLFKHCGIVHGFSSVCMHSGKIVHCVMK